MPATGPITLMTIEATTVAPMPAGTSTAALTLITQTTARLTAFVLTPMHITLIPNATQLQHTRNSRRLLRANMVAYRIWNRRRRWNFWITFILQKNKLYHMKQKQISSKRLQIHKTETENLEFKWMLRVPEIDISDFRSSTIGEAAVAM